MRMRPLSRLPADAVHHELSTPGYLRVRRSLVDHPQLDALSRRAARFAGFLLPHLPDDLLEQVVAAWEIGDTVPIEAAAAQFAWTRERLLYLSDADDGFVACRCELACRGSAKGALLIRVSAPSSFGMNAEEQDAVGEEFVFESDTSTD